MDKGVKNLLSKALIIAMAASTLSGCGLFVAGAVGAGAVSTADRRTYGAQTEDKAIVVKGEVVINEIIKDKGHVNISAFNRKALLTGEVATQELKDKIGKEVSEIKNVRSVANEIMVMESSEFLSRGKDSVITSKVVARLIAKSKVYSTTIKVVTERGIVYLLGQVTRDEAKMAAEVASEVADVQKVVTLFEYVSEEELKETDVRYHDFSAQENPESGVAPNVPGDAYE